MFIFTSRVVNGNSCLNDGWENTRNVNENSFKIDYRTMEIQEMCLEAKVHSQRRAVFKFNNYSR